MTIFSLKGLAKAQERLDGGATQKFIVKGHRPPGAGWQPIPHGRKGGFRKRGRDGWDYWYPSDDVPKKHAWSEDDFAGGKFDKDPQHWHYRRLPGKEDAIGWTAGGVNPKSKHPVKEAGRPHRLMQIVDANHDKGWAKLRDVQNGEERIVAHDRIYPVYYDKEKPKPAAPKPGGPKWSPTDVAKPTAVTGVSGGQKVIFEDSKAKPGTALHKMENGSFIRHTAVIYEEDANGEPIRIETTKTEVDNHTKTKLLAEFEPLIQSIAKKVKASFALRSRYSYEGERRTDETLADIRSSAMEGFLVAVERYDGRLPFAHVAKMYATEYARAHAAEHVSGVSITKTVRRLIPGFIAARIEAGKAFATDNPTPEQIAKHWRLRKRDIHSGLDVGDPQRHEDVPLGPYKLKVKEVVRTGDRRRTHTTDVDTIGRPGKVEWAERLHSFLTGQASASGGEFSEESAAVFPTVPTGFGLSAKDRVTIRSKMDKVLSQLTRHEITKTTGRQTTTYRANVATIVKRMLGLEGDDEQGARSVAKDIPILKKTGKGWKRLAQRQSETLIQEFLQHGLSRVREVFARDNEHEAAAAISRATDRLIPAAEAKPGPTFRQLIRKRAKEMDPQRIVSWKERERTRLTQLAKRPDMASAAESALRRLDRMGDREAAVRVAMSDIAQSSPAIRAMQTHTVTVDPTPSLNTEYGWTVVTYTDLATGRQRRVRMRTVRSLRPYDEPISGTMNKSEAELDETIGLIRDAVFFPRLTALLADSDSMPTVDRLAVETMVGLH